MSRKIEKIRNTNWTEIKVILNRCQENDLLRLIYELYGLSTSNKDFLEARFLHDGKALDRYKDQIKRNVSPNEPWKENQKISLKGAKKILSDYKKATNDKVGLIDLMLYYVECGTDFLRNYGDMYEQYYASLESVFDNSLKLMHGYDHGEIENYIERAKTIVKKAQMMGWGYGDNLTDMLRRFYS